MQRYDPERDYTEPFEQSDFFLRNFGPNAVQPNQGGEDSDGNPLQAQEANAIVRFMRKSERRPI